MAVQTGSRRAGPSPHVEGDSPRGFDRGFLLLGAGLIVLLALGLTFGVRDLVVVTTMTVLLWLSVGVVMVLSRVLNGRWE